MTEQALPTGSDDASSEPSSDPSSDSVPAGGEARTTGVLVDGALAAVDRLEDLPVEEHLAAFEQAHDLLRAALDAPSVEQPGEPA
jgi:hypothetical protein